MGVPGAAEPAASMEVSPRRLGAEALVETTCFLRGLPSPPASGRVERNGVESRPLLGPAGIVWGRWVRLGVLDSFGGAGAVEVSPLRAAGALRSRRRVGLWACCVL